MPEQSINYGKTVCDMIIDFIRKTDDDNPFHSYFYGDPGPIPYQQLPALVVDLQDTDIDLDATQTDSITQTIIIKVVVNKLTFIEEFDDSTVSWKKKLEQLVQGVDPVNNQYDPTSLVSILRTNLTLANYLVENKIRTKYGEMPRNGLDDEWTGEAHMTMTVQHLQLRPPTT